MRCFVAVKLPIEIKDYLFDLQKKIRSENAKINFVHKKNLHLTLKFLGELNEKEVEEVKRILRKVKFKKFEVYLDEVGVFPNEGYIRVVWVGLKPVRKVFELQQKIDSELLTIFSKDEKFSAHLTIGRVKFIKNTESFLEVLKNLEVKNKSFLVDKSYLIESELRKEGPKYSDLDVFELN